MPRSLSARALRLAFATLPVFVGFGACEQIAVAPEDAFFCEGDSRVGIPGEYLLLSCPTLTRQLTDGTPNKTPGSFLPGLPRDSKVRSVQSRDSQVEVIGIVYDHPTRGDAGLQVLVRISTAAPLGPRAPIGGSSQASTGVDVYFQCDSENASATGVCSASIQFPLEIVAPLGSQPPAPPRLAAVESGSGSAHVSMRADEGVAVAWMSTDVTAPIPLVRPETADELINPNDEGLSSYHDHGFRDVFAVVATQRIAGREWVTYSEAAISPSLALSLTKDGVEVGNSGTPILVVPPGTLVPLLALPSGGVVTDGEYSIRWSFAVDGEPKADGTGPNIEFMVEEAGTLTVTATDDFENTATSTVDVLSSAAPNSLRLVVTGDGGRVVSDVGGIFCAVGGPSSQTCFATFDEVTEVILTAEDAEEFVWGSACGEALDATARLSVLGNVVCEVELRQSPPPQVYFSITGPTQPVMPGEPVNLAVAGDMEQLFQESVEIQWFDREALGLTGPSITVTPAATTDYTARAVSEATGIVLGEGTIRVVVLLFSDIPLYLELPQNSPNVNTRWTLAPRYFDATGQLRLFHIDYPDATCRWTVSFDGQAPQEFSFSPCVPVSFGPTDPMNPPHVVSQSGSYEVSIEATVPANGEHGQLIARPVGEFSFILQ